MANPVFRTNQFFYSHAQPEALFAKVTIGASGAPTLVKGTGMGISSITRVSAGRYTIAFSHAYAALLGLTRTTVSASAPTAPATYVVADNTTSKTAPGITIITNVTGTATDPASGEVMLIEVLLQKSSVAY